MAEQSSRVRALRVNAGVSPAAPPATVEDKDACALYAAVAKDATPAPRADPDRARRAPEDAPPRRQRRRRGRRLRRADRHPARDLGRGGPRRRPRLAAGARPAVRGRPHLHPAQGRQRRGDQGAGPRDHEPRRPARAGRARGRGGLARRSARTAREEEPHLLAGRRPDRASRAPLLRAGRGSSSRSSTCTSPRSPPRPASTR